MQFTNLFLDLISSSNDYLTFRTVSGVMLVRNIGIDAADQRRRTHCIQLL
jgi:hypothetical protein